MNWLKQVEWLGYSKIVLEVDDEGCVIVLFE